MSSSQRKKGTKRCIRWSESDLQAHHSRRGKTGQRPVAPVQKRKKKYNNTQAVVDGRTFDSIREANRYKELKLMETGGVIEDLECQVGFELAPSVMIQGRKRPPLRYYADFVYRENGIQVVEDAKGKADGKYKIKRHLMKHLHNIDIIEV